MLEIADDAQEGDLAYAAARILRRIDSLVGDEQAYRLVSGSRTNEPKLFLHGGSFRDGMCTSLARKDGSPDEIECKA